MTVTPSSSESSAVEQPELESTATEQAENLLDVEQSLDAMAQDMADDIPENYTGDRQLHSVLCFHELHDQSMVFSQEQFCRIGEVCAPCRKCGSALFTTKK